MDDLNEMFEPGFGDAKQMAAYDRTQPSEPIGKEVEFVETNSVKLNLNIAKFTNIEIELNDLSDSGKDYIAERIETALKIVDAYGYKEVK